MRMTKWRQKGKGPKKAMRTMVLSVVNLGMLRAWTSARYRLPCLDSSQVWKLWLKIRQTQLKRSNKSTRVSTKSLSLTSRLSTVCHPARALVDSNYSIPCFLVWQLKAPRMCWRLSNRHHFLLTWLYLKKRSQSKPFLLTCPKRVQILSHQSFRASTSSLTNLAASCSCCSLVLSS